MKQINVESISTIESILSTIITTEDSTTASAATEVITTATSHSTTEAPAPLIGITVAGRSNGKAGTTKNALRNPWGLVVKEDGSIFISDYNNYRVMKIREGNLTGSVVAGTEAHGSSARKLHNPAEIAVDAASNIYIADTLNYRVMLWRRNAASGIRLFGNSTTFAIGALVGLAVDSKRNVYVADYDNHCVMKWAPNATSGTLVAGIVGVPGSSNQHLHRPYGLYLDEDKSYIYIADFHNDRIQRYRLGMPMSGTTVAGGNGKGSGGNQLHEPYGMCASKITGDIYIADKNNHRIQRWSPGATNGVTIAGITGLTGTNATLLHSPVNVALNKNETFLYVSEIDNHRVQRFKLT